MTALLAAAPALPLHSAGKYVAGAYVVFVAIVLIYVGIMAVRLSRTERELTQLRRDLDERRRAEDGDRDFEIGREPDRLSETGGRAFSSDRGTGRPAEELL